MRNGGAPFPASAEAGYAAPVRTPRTATFLLAGLALSALSGCAHTETEAVAAGREGCEAIELRLDGRMLRPGEIRHQAAAFFSGVR